MAPENDLKRGTAELMVLASLEGRRRRYYKLTPAGRKVLAEQRENWRELRAAVQRVAGIAPIG